MKVNIKKFASSKLTQGQAAFMIDAYLDALRVNNNIHWIHWHARGENFNEIHELADHYYEELNKDVDYLAELCLQYGLSIPHPLSYMDVAPVGKVINTELNYEYEDAIENIEDNLNSLIQSIKTLADSLDFFTHKGTITDLGSILGYWEKEVEYKLKRSER